MLIVGTATCRNLVCQHLSAVAAATSRPRQQFVQAAWEVPAVIGLLAANPYHQVVCL